MLRLSLRNLKSIGRVTNKQLFSANRTIPTDEEQQAGRRKLELDEEAAGRVAFNADPIVPPSNAGTFENPILVTWNYRSYSVNANLRVGSLW